MGKASKWLRNFFTGKKKAKDNAGDSNPEWPTENSFSPVTVTATKEKRWSFRRSVGATKEFDFADSSLSEPFHGFLDSEIDQKRHHMAVAVATAAAAEVAVVAAKAAAAAVVRLTATANCRATRAIEEASAIKIQSVFRSYLARKALTALKGLVKMQALVRGYLVRKQANSTLRCMEALVKAQHRARAERIRMVEESQSTPLKLQNYRKSPHHRFDMDCNEEEYVKIVEMDLGGRSYSSSRTPQFSPAPLYSPQLSAMAMAAHASSDYALYPNYMANTESSRAKLRSQSAPKQRIDAFERQPSRRRQSGEGRNVPRGISMQRSSSQAGLRSQIYEYPWFLKLDKSNMSVIESECGSTSTVLTDRNYCRSLAGF